MDWYLKIDLRNTIQVSAMTQEVTQFKLIKIILV